MDKLSTRLPTETLSALESYADANDLSNAAAARELIQSALTDERGPSVDERIESVRAEYEDEINALETEIERLTRERRQLLEMRDENTSLVCAREREVSLAERRASVGVLTRARWWFTGVPEDGE